MQKLKSILRNLLSFLRLDLTKNLEYDRLTKQILKSTLHQNSNCIDIGCHKGEILDLFIKYAPKGKHLAFEPIPDFYHRLTEKYPQVNVYNYALSNSDGEVSFNYVKNAPAYSGLQQRHYAIKHPEIEKITVQKSQLDAIIPSTMAIDLIKIDVEGGELNVLKGAIQLIKKQQPIIVFECGLGASDFYGTSPEDVFDYFSEIHYDLFLLKDFIERKVALNKNQFIRVYQSNEEYYFIASKKKNN